MTTHLNQSNWFDLPWYQVFSALPNTLKRQVVELNISLNKPLSCMPLLNQLMSERAAALNLPSFTLIAQPELNMPYEAWIAQHKTIPTRSNWHDVFNALIWLVFPRTKRVLNRIQASEIATHGIARTRIRDAATLFDENAAILLCSDATYFEALTQRKWTHVLWEQREDFLKNTRLIVFGHALLEKLRNPYKAITTHLFCLVAPKELPNYFNWHTGWHDAPNPNSIDGVDAIDLQLSQSLSNTFDNGQLLPQFLFTPLPILGIPNWTENTPWEQNQAFYEDKQVFRLGKE